jgi:hypothetical protein
MSLTHLPACASEMPRFRSTRYNRRRGEVFIVERTLKLTPRIVRRVILPVSYFIFLGGVLISAAIFYRGRPFDAKAAILSDLQSPDDNPHGYAASAMATTLSAILLIPAVATFHRWLRNERPKLALAGSVGLTVGLTAAIALGFLAPFTHGYTPLHIQVTAAAFIGVSAGAWLHLLAARGAAALLIFQFGALLALVFLCYGPVEFDNTRLLTGLAFWEWVLCVDCAAVLWGLARVVEKKSVTKFRKTGAV